MPDKEKSYIFLDIDGVLAINGMSKSDRKTWYNDWAYPFTKECVRAFNKILEKTDAEIILSSDWRRVFELDEIKEVFKFNGVIKYPVAYTNILHDRDWEIREIIVRNKLSKFVIIDDMELTIYKERFIRTNPDMGLQNEHVQRIIKLLK